MAKQDPMICIRDTYLHGKLWKSGDVFVPPYEGAEPNRHFTINGVVSADERRRAVYGPADDVRSTEEMRRLCIEAEMPGVNEDTTRKELFNFLVKYEKSNPPEVAAAPQEKAPAHNPDNAGAVHDPSKKFENPILNKMFLEMTPDDINTLKTKEIKEKLSRPPYSLQLGSGQVSKADLVKRGVAIEEQKSRH